LGRYYRSQAGVAVVNFEVDQETVMGLIAEGLLNPADAENREAIAKALKQVISVWLISRGCP
jgi:hypothetical protein